MKEALQKLRTIEPSEDTLRAIKLRVDERVRELKTRPHHVVSPYVSFFQQSRKVSFFLVPAMAFSFLFVFGLYSAGYLEQTKLAVTIASAPHAHASSRIALASLDKQSEPVLLAMADTADMDDLSRAISVSTKTLDGLKLMGEPGKYTLEECLSDYHDFYEKLEDLKDAVNKLPYPSTVEGVMARNNLLTKINQAMNESEARIGDYPSHEK
jgi:hypothetical protein